MSAVTNGAAAAGPVGGSQRITAPDDVVPRLVGLGMPVEAAQRLVEHTTEQRVADALDALDEFDADHRIVDPIGWVDAAVRQRWDLTGVLANRREREQRLAALHSDQERREAARSAWPAWRAIAERWETTVSAALADDQLARAIDRLTDDVPGIGRRSVPVARAELIAWAVDVHERDPDVPLSVALAEDLARDPRPGPARPWPLPEPPARVAPAAENDVAPLTDRVAAAIDTDRAPERLRSAEIAIPVPQRGLSRSEDVGR